ncbi:MAG: DUF2029 domain-containing protein [Crocinitomicaceae bacterium]|nr:DUF2029 domain-containing protein [Crocinitomicaceae bacterium]
MQSKTNYGLALFLILPIVFIGYWIDRHDSVWLLACFAISFVGYITLLRSKKCTLKELLVIGILVRLLLLGATPKLSDDYYRFAFDGQLILSGENPYTVLPNEIEQRTDFETSLVKNMNSPGYYSVYPPINQIFFSLPSFFSGENLIIYAIFLRILIILFEILMALVLLKLLQFFDKNLHLFALYFLNPLVVVELTGNLHFEGVTMFFFLLSILFLVKGKILRSGIVFAIAVGTKLIPLLFLPFFIKRLKQQSIAYFTIVALGILILFIPFVNEKLLGNIASSVDLYFHTFMFNGSIFYVMNTFLQQITGFEYNLYLLGDFTPYIVLVAVLLMAILEKNKGWLALFKSILFSLLIYYSIASVVHPWYVINLMVVALFTNYRFPYVWSALVLLSYVAYKGNGLVIESTVLLIVEYVLLSVVIGVELIRAYKKRVGGIHGAGVSTRTLHQ